MVTDDMAISLRLFWCGRDETQPTLHNLFAAPHQVQGEQT
jgi:hypothetical protein